MMETICESLNIKGFLNSPACPPMFQRCVEIIEDEPYQGSFDFSKLQELILTKDVPEKQVAIDERLSLSKRT